MLICDRKDIENDLKEVANEFPEAENEDIIFSFTADGSAFTVKAGADEGNFPFDSAAALNGEYADERMKTLEIKRVFKHSAKRALYDFLSDRYKRDLPWGALTGIRPTKLAYRYGESGMFRLKEEMRVGEAKYELLGHILAAQKPYYETDDANAAFYAGIPFCPTRCEYCSFISAEIGKCKLVDEYVDALCGEIYEAKKLVKKLRSVYIGGGTPVSLDIKNFEKVLDALGEPKCEYTVEAGRPDCINADVLSAMKEHGVTRTCVNPQTFCDETLKLLGRSHTAAQTEEKFALAKTFGFDVNMDLIAGLPYETFAIFADSLEKAITLDPENITVHTLCLKKGSRLKEICARLPEGEVAKMIDYSAERLEKAGYEPYYLYRQKYMAGNLENTGWSKKGKECVYNVDVMEETAQNVACGAGAVSKRVYNSESRIERLGAPKDIRTYIDKTDRIISDKAQLFC